jgi:hypothetical protein
MRKNRFSGINFDALKLEGALFTADMVQKITSGEAKRQSIADYAILPGLGLPDEIGRSFQIAQALWIAYKSGKSTELVPKLG